MSTVDTSCGGMFPCPPPSGVILTVGPAQTFPTIQLAVTASVPGDTILVFPAIYQEEITVPVGKDNIFLISQTPLAAVIIPPVLLPSTALITILATCVRVSGFTIQGPSLTPGTLLRGINIINGGSGIIDNNLIQDIRENLSLGPRAARALMLILLVLH
jgi:hypothetical protein